MAGYNSEYTRTTKNFVFLDAKEATIPKAGITWGPYKLKEAAKAKEPAADRPKKVSEQKAPPSVEQAANELMVIAEYLANKANIDEKERKAKKTAFAKKHAAAKLIDGFTEKYTVYPSHHIIEEKKSDFGKSSSSFGAATTYNFACWFYTGDPVKEGDSKEIAKLAKDEIGADIELHATTTTLTRADTSRCLHESLVDTVPAFGAIGDDVEAKTNPVSLVQASSVSNAAAEAAQKKAEAKEDEVKEAEAKEAEAGSASLAAASTPAAATKKDAAAKKKGDKKKAPASDDADAAPQETAINVDVNFAEFGDSANKCMIAYMKDQQPGEEAQQAQPSATPPTYVFYTIHATAANVVLPEPVKSVDVDAGPPYVTPNSSASSPGPTKVVAPPKPKKPPAPHGLNDHIPFADGAKFFRRAYVPSVLCDVRVTDAMEYLLTRILVVDAGKSPIGYYKSVLLVQTLMMSSTYYEANGSVDAVKVHLYNEKDETTEFGSIDAIDHSVPQGTVFGVHHFGSDINTLVTRLQLIYTENTTDIDIAKKIYEIDLSGYKSGITRIDISSACAAINTKFKTPASAFRKISVQLEIQPVYAKITYMYARLFRQAQQTNEILVYMKKDGKQPKAVNGFVVPLYGATKSGPVSLATPTLTGLSATIDENSTKIATEISLNPDEVKLSLRLTKENPVITDSGLLFKAGYKWSLDTSNDDDIKRAKCIASAWATRPAVGGSLPPMPAAGPADTLFGRGMSRFV